MIIRYWIKKISLKIKITFEKITDTCIFLMSINNDGIDEFGNELFSTIYNYNLPTSIFAVQV